MFSPEELSRYSRHLRLRGFGLEGQQRLRNGSVLIVGLGGLGSPAALYLAAAGVGCLGLCDHDQVALHNLQRQVLFSCDDVGESKVEQAARRLRALNPHTHARLHPEGVLPENALRLIERYDVVLDCCDNFPTRFLLGDACALAGRPLVAASLHRFEARITVFDPAGGGPCSRCLFPQPPTGAEPPNCAEAGVLGAICGVAGSLQALEAIKLLSGVGEALRGRLLIHDALAGQADILHLPRRHDCALCGSHPTITSLDPLRYPLASCCVADTPSAPMSHEELPLEVTVQQARAQLQGSGPKPILLDVREADELAICQIQGRLHIPMQQVPHRLGDLPQDAHILVQCHHGGRSMKVTQFLRSKGYAKAQNIQGGIEAWALQIEPGMARY